MDRDLSIAARTGGARRRVPPLRSYVSTIIEDYHCAACERECARHRQRNTWHQASRAKRIRSLVGQSPQETSWFSKPFGAWHESVCTRFRANRQLIAVAGQVCRGKSAHGRSSSAAQTRFQARYTKRGGNPIRWLTWNSFDADLSAEKKRDSIELLAPMPSVARLSRGRAEAARQGQKALTKLMAAVGLFLRMTARTSVIAKRWTRAAAIFLRASVVVLSCVRFQLSVFGARRRGKYFVGPDTSRLIASPSIHSVFWHTDCCATIEH